MEGRLLARARARLDARRQANRDEGYRRREEVYGLIPELRAIDDGLRAIMTELVRATLGASARPVAEMERESLALQKRRGELLRAHGKPEDYLAEIFTCPRCRDTGWLEQGGICECLRALYKQEQTRELAPLLQRTQERFENFRLDYYSAAAAQEGAPSPRARMERIFHTCRRFAESFAPGAGNLLFSGGPGLGKTFLSASIARVVAEDERGFAVAYDTAAGLLSAFEREHFTRDDAEREAASSRVRQLTDCDLLILDDLGTELATAFTASALYTLIDGRLRAQRSTIITTNLDRDSLAERYGPQLASRLGGEYQWLTFLGRDIRAVKKERD